MTSRPLFDSLPPHVRKTLEEASTTQLSMASTVHTICQIYSLSLSEGPQTDALTTALEAHARAAQLDMIETILKSIKLRDPHSHFLITALGYKIGERATTALTRLENLLTMFPT